MRAVKAKIRELESRQGRRSVPLRRAFNAFLRGGQTPEEAFAMVAQYTSEAFQQRLRDEGRQFTSNNLSETATGDSRGCFANVFSRLYLGTPYLGWVLFHNFPIPHAWLVKGDGSVLEVTPGFEGEHVYYGAPIGKGEYMRATDTTHGVWETLTNPLLSRPKKRRRT